MADIVSMLRYDPTQQNQLADMYGEAMAKRSADYEQMSKLVPEAQAMYEATPVTESNIDYLNQSATQLKTDLSDLLEKYGGDYGDPLFRREASKKLSQTKTNVAKLNRDYEQYQKYAPIRNQLAAQNKLIDLAPENTSTFQDGKYTPYNWGESFLERSDYRGLVMNDIGNIINRFSIDKGLSDAEKDFYLKQVSEGGLNAIDNAELEDRIKRYIPEFKEKSTYKVDPQTEQWREQGEEGDYNYINNILQTGVGRTTDNKYMQDIGGLNDHKTKLKNAEDAKLRRPIFSGTDVTRLERNPYVPESTSYSEFLEERFSAADGVINLEKYKGNNLQELIDLMDEQIVKLNSPGSENGIGSRGPIGALSKDKSKDLKEAKNVINSIKSDIDIAKRNWIADKSGKKIDDLSDKEYSKYKKEADNINFRDWVKEIDANNDLLTMSTAGSVTILDDNTKSALQDKISSSLNNLRFTVGNHSTKSTFIDDVAKNLEVNPQTLRNHIKDNKNFNYNISRGEYYIDIPSKFNNDGTVDKDATTKRLYFNIDRTTQYVQQGLQKLVVLGTKGNKNEKGVEEEEEVFIPGIGTYIYDPTSSTKKHSKTQGKFKTYDLNGNFRGYESIYGLEESVKTFNEQYLRNRYTKANQTVTELKNVE